MRVLFWPSSFLPTIGGVQNLAADLLPALEERGHRHVVVTAALEGEDQTITHYQNIAVHRVCFANAWNQVDRLAPVRRYIADLKRAFRPDLVHIYGLSNTNFFEHLTRDVEPAPLLVSLHGRFPALTEQTLKRADWVVGCSEALRGAALRYAPEILPRCSVIHNARQPPPFEPGSLRSRPPRLLCVGRLAAEKGFDIAVAAFGKILRRFPEAQLTLAGDGSEREKLLRQIDEAGLTSRVEMTGWVDREQTSRLLDSATVVLVPSRREGFSLVAAEAASMARPVIASAVGGLPEVVVDRETGLLVAPEDADALADAIVSILECPDAAAAMGRRGRARIGRKFSWHRFVDAYDALYRDLGTQAGKSSAGPGVCTHTS
jgi:glycogen(starch) synthase